MHLGFPNEPPCYLGPVCLCVDNLNNQGTASSWNSAGEMLRTLVHTVSSLKLFG